MVDELQEIFEKNKTWSEQVEKKRPGFFLQLSQQQTPKILWVGCSDSRVPATQICGLDPGDIFVHRNIANLVVSSDLNFCSVLQYAVDVLKVTDVVVCGHYGCGGVAAAIKGKPLGVIDQWLENIKTVLQEKKPELNAYEQGSEAQTDRLCELNVIHQVKILSKLSTVSDAWDRGQTLRLHGWIYDLKTGRLKNLEATQSHP